MAANDVVGAITVGLVDDHPVVLEGVQSWIGRDRRHRVRLVASGGTVDEVVSGQGGQVDVLVLDLNLDGTSVLDQIAGLSASGHRVVVFSQDTDEQTILAVMDRGALAYIAKHEGAEHFVDTFVATAGDRPYVTPSAAGAMWADESPTRPSLSDRERTALLLWFQGMSKASVASRMAISVHTANQYINRARIKYAKAGRPGPTKAALLARAIEDGLIRLDEVGDYRSYAARRVPPEQG